jgi:outer membrane receptor protein involved in Fe transport
LGVFILVKTRFRFLAALVAFALSVTVGAQRLVSQAFEAQLTGVVKDASGAVVPNAQLKVTNLATHVSYTGSSNDQGIYRFPNLPPAEYRVTCTLQGFKTFEQNRITLQVAQALELNVTLQPGEMSEQITITAAPPPLETGNATLGQVVTTRSVQNLPLNIRDPLALVALTPGVVLGSNFGNGGGNDVGRNFFKSDFNVGGGRSGSQEILMDGAPDTTPDINRGVINPPVDSVQEFKVQAQSFDAQFGRTSGGIVNVITKSGTNDYHGLAYDFERHSVLDANNWFNNASRLSLPSFQRHQFGGNVGGPILHGKWFAFGDYEALRQGYPQTSLSTVPTALQRQGDFSQTFTTVAGQTRQIQIFDPATVTTLANGTRQRTAFPGNVIPTNRFSPVAQATLGFLPLPNLPGNAVTGQNNYIYSADSTLNSNKYDLRTDANFTDATRMFVRFSRQQDVRSVPGTLPPPAGGGRFTTDHYTQAVADLSHVFSPNLVGDIQFAFTRALASQYGASLGFDLSQLKLPAGYTSVVAPLFPVFNISDVVGTSNRGDSFTQFQPRNVWSTLGSITWQHGKHSLKFGGDWRILNFNEGQNSSASGTFSFERQFTQGPNAVQASATSGYGFASFLLGTPSSGNVNAINPISTQGLYYAAYVQDDWKVSDRLTLNIGLRWDVGIGNREKYNRLAYFDPSVPNPLGVSVPGFPNLSGALRWIGRENPKDQQATDWKNFGPRFGFAYKLNNKTVLRGGYGIFFLPRNIQGNGDGAVEAVRTTTMVATLYDVNPYNTIDNPFPQGILPPLNDRDPLANVGSSIAAPQHAFRNGYSQTWSFGVQRELPWGLLLDAHYWGSKSTALPVTWNLNQLPDQYLALGSRLNNPVPNPFFGIITNGALAAPTTSQQQLLLPFPQYTSITQVFVPVGNSTYEAGTLQLEKRLSTNLTFLAVYTRSKGIDDVRTPIDTYNRRLEKALSGFDAPNQFRFSGVWNVPFGHGRAFGNGTHPVVNFLLGGWDLSGIVTVQSGFPVGISRTANNNGQSAALDSPTIGAWFDKSVFSVAPSFTYGNTGPFLPDVRTDSVRNVDAVLVKNFTLNIRDRAVRTQFRSEFYNLFNHPQFGTPNGTVTSQAFGTVTSQANSPRDIQFGLKVSF